MTFLKMLTTALRSVAGVAIGTLLVGVLGDQVAGYYADVREASNLKDGLTTQVASLTAEEADLLQVLAEDLMPSSYLVVRCADPKALPKQLGSPASVCREAIVQEMLEEQQAFLDIRSKHLEGQILEKRLQSSLEDDMPSQKYATLLTGLESLRKLNSSTTCGPERAERAESLFRSYPWIDQQTVDALVGPDIKAPCDHHGEEYPAAAASIARGLAFEGEVVGVAIRESRVNDRTDTREELLKSVFRDPLLLILLLVGVPGALLLLRQPPKE